MTPTPADAVTIEAIAAAQRLLVGEQFLEDLPERLGGRVVAVLAPGRVLLGGLGFAELAEPAEELLALLSEFGLELVG